MLDTTTPATRPADPRFSSGPCAKIPQFSLDMLADAPLGRKRVLTPSPVAQAAGDLGLPVGQPRARHRHQPVREDRHHHPDDGAEDQHRRPRQQGRLLQCRNLRKIGRRRPLQRNPDAPAAVNVFDALMPVLLPLVLSTSSPDSV